MKKTIILASIIYAALHLEAQDYLAPKIIFEETVFNFDTIVQGSKGEHVFKFANKGNAPLLIISAFSSCGCVIPEWPKLPIDPNATASIKVKYNTSKIGSFTKVIVVKSNDEESPKTILRIIGVVAEDKGHLKPTK